MIPGKPLLTFLVFAGLVRALDAWATPPPLVGWAVVAYGGFLLVNYWDRVRKQRKARGAMAT